MRRITFRTDPVYIFISVLGICTFVSFIFPSSSQSIALCIASILESMSATMLFSLETCYISVVHCSTYSR